MAFRNFVVTGEWRGRTARFRNDQIIVSVLDSVPVREIKNTIAAAISAVSGATIRSFRAKRRWAIIGLPQGVDVAQVAAAIAHERGIRYAEPDFVLYGHVTPDDDHYGSQGWPQTINLEKAWDVTQGDASVLLAVMDSGIQMDPEHPDLSDPLGARVYITQHVDAMGTPVNHDYVDSDETPEDEHGHGTWVTGILAAMSNNDQGVAGVNWNSNVYVARVLDSETHLPKPRGITPPEDGEGGNPPITYVSVVKLAMEDLRDYATANKYDRVVVNMSFGSADPAYKEGGLEVDLGHEMESLKQMCAENAEFDIDGGLTGRFILCCAPGFSSGPNLPRIVDYPARFTVDFAHVISVGSTDGADVIQLPSANKEPANEKEVTILAPGHQVPYATLRGSAYGQPTIRDVAQKGTSFASPMVAGVVSLMWSANPVLTPAEIKDCLVNTGKALTRNGRTYRRLDAGLAVRNAKRSISLDTPVLSFIDISAGTSDDRGVEMAVTSCASLNFKVKSTSMDAAFTIAEDSDSMSHDPASSAGVVTGIKVTYAAGGAGTTAFGSIVIECEQSGETWTVYLTANTVGAPAMAVVLVADKSGSMAASSGINTDSRMDVLHEALEVAVETLQSGDACAVVSFDTDAATVEPLVNITGNEPGAGERDPLYTAISSLIAGGATSIGDGVRLASTLVSASGERSPALLVVTDGNENTAEFISDVMDEIDVPVYAIGMGTADVIRPEALESLTATTGGYLLLTDTLDEENRYKIAKYCLQMLSQVTGSGLIVDPSGRIRPGQQVDVPFWISSEDYSCDVMVLMPSKGAVDVELVSPDEHRIDASSRLPGVEFRSGDHMSRYRLSMAEVHREKGVVGRWIARLSIDEGSLRTYGKKLKGRQRVRLDAHGAPYCALVSCRSGVSMDARAYAAAHEPGSQVLLRSVIMERGLPVRSPAAVTARITLPDGTQSQCRLTRVASGVNEYEFNGRLPGVYTCRVRATGFTSRGDRYQREQTITAHIWNEPHGAVSSAPRGPIRPR